MRSMVTASVAAASIRRGPWRPRDRLQAYAAIAIVSFACYILARLLDGGVSTAFSVVGVGACGWAWLVARALFDPAERDAGWAPVVGVVVAVSGALGVLAPGGGLISRVADNTYTLSGSAALLLTFVEPFARYRRDLPATERRFRFVFVGVYAAMVAVSVLGLRAVGEGPDEALRDDLIKSACALAGLGAIVACVWFRRRHPLAPPTAAPALRAATAEDMRLAERLARLLDEEQIDSRPDLKIGDVAARLGQPEYRISQCIRAALGFPNFNRWINHHRIERARRLLADPEERRSILQIAFVCGFASLGPFNRAFREELGTTPRAYRSASRATPAKDG